MIGSASRKESDAHGTDSGVVTRATVEDGRRRQRCTSTCQVREYVRALVDGAEPGTPAPSERELVQHFGVARMTVRQAIDALVAEGLLERVPGRGTFVATSRGPSMSCGCTASPRR